MNGRKIREKLESFRTMLSLGLASMHVGNIYYFYQHISATDNLISRYGTIARKVHFTNEHHHSET